MKNSTIQQIVGISNVIRNLRDKINKISKYDVNILISGESGTGKELAALAIHALSYRAGKAFIPVNCGAIPDSLFENELFGHVKGAFTDASFRQIGLVKEAEGGTLFLDEISVISHFIQVKLLRLVQEKEYKSLGNPRSYKADIRIIAATNSNLRSLILKGRFREDLFFRLNIVPLYIPPLRERKQDIPVLVNHFVLQYSKKYNNPIKSVTEDAMRIFTSYSWPGNIRELENIIQQIIVMSSTPVIASESIPFYVKEPGYENYEFKSFKEAKRKVIHNFEKNYIIQLLKTNGGNVSAAAKNAEHSRTALWNLIRKYSISTERFRK